MATIGTAMRTRPAAVSGQFYPARREALERSIAGLLAAQPEGHEDAKALIVPHAGYVYSGGTAARGYRLLEHRRESINRVVLLGPAHRAYLEGMAVPSVDAFTTPLGDVRLDKDALDRVIELPGMQVSDAAHAGEHSLEVHLPFLQVVLSDFRIVPIVIGVCDPGDVEGVIEALWGGDETLIIVSSDLSHYHSYADARSIDAKTTARIEALEPILRGEEACGAHALNGLLLAASAHGLAVRTLELRNSGDTAGDRDRVVGYGAYVLA
jgi:AmmeMemoRadiSam system protein B